MRIKLSTIDELLLFLAVVLLLLDKPIQYFVESVTGVPLPTNQALALIVVVLLLIRNFQMPLTGIWFTCFLLCYISLVWGAFLIDSFSVVSAFSIFFPFSIGLFFADAIYKKDWYYRGLLVVAILPAFLSVLALVVGALPVLYQIHQVDGESVGRPEIFTDQNFHIMYVYWVLPLLLLLEKRWEYLLWGIVLAVNFYTLNKLQTRSGVLYLSLTLLLVLWKFDFKAHKKWLIWSGLLFLAAAAFMAPQLTKGILESDIYVRFTIHSDASDETGSHRITSFLYWMLHIVDFKYWVPFGNSEFTALHDGSPHSNGTALYLNGGILGLFGFLSLIVYPAVRSIKRYFFTARGSEVRAHHLDLSLSIAVMMMLLVQLSLNLPYNEQVWFWSGVGVHLILKARRVKTNKEEISIRMRENARY